MEGNTSSSPCREQTRFTCNKIIDTSLRALYQIWDKMGIEETQRKMRGDTAIAHIKNLMHHMISEEETLMNEVAKTIEEFTEKLDQLCSELSLPHIKMSGGLTMVQKEKILRSKVETMAKEKKDRMAKYETLHKRDQQLSEALSTNPYHIPPGKVPTLEQLRELDKHVTHLQSERDKRFSEFITTKKKILELYSALEHEPDTSFGCDLVCEDDESFGLSTENMQHLQQLHDELVKKNQEMKLESDQLWERLRALWNRVETPDFERKEFESKMKGHSATTISALKSEIEACERLKFQNIQKFVNGLRTELVTWWDKCFMSKEQKTMFTPFTDDQYTEELLNVHEQELGRVQEYYKSRKDILDKVARREELFNKMIQFEEKARDPNRFFCDRGGKLLQEEKARKKLTKELPKVEDELTEAILKWEQDNHTDFLVDGVKFSEYVKNKWENFHLQKEQQKQSRLKAKAKQTQDEMLYGSKSASQTPIKRKMAPTATPVRTPLKTRKVNDTVRTPSTTGKLSNLDKYSTVMHSPVTNHPLIRTKTTFNKSVKKRSVQLMKNAALGNRSRRKSKSGVSQTLSENINSSLASHASYHDFAEGLSDPDSHSSVASILSK